MSDKNSGRPRLFAQRESVMNTDTTEDPTTKEDKDAETARRFSFMWTRAMPVLRPHAQYPQYVKDTIFSHCGPPSMEPKSSGRKELRKPVMTLRDPIKVAPPGYKINSGLGHINAGFENFINSSFGNYHGHAKHYGHGYGHVNIDGPSTSNFAKSLHKKTEPGATIASSSFLEQIYNKYCDKPENNDDMWLDANDLVEMGLKSKSHSADYKPSSLSIAMAKKAQAMLDDMKIKSIQSIKPTLFSNLVKTVKTAMTTSDAKDFPHVLEMSRIPDSFTTADLQKMLGSFNKFDYKIIWVGRTRAMIICSSVEMAADILAMTHPLIITKPLCQGSVSTRIKANLNLPELSLDAVCASLKQRKAKDKAARIQAAIQDDNKMDTSDTAASDGAGAI